MRQTVSVVLTATALLGLTGAPGLAQLPPASGGWIAVPVRGEDGTLRAQTIPPPAPTPAPAPPASPASPPASAVPAPAKPASSAALPPASAVLGSSPAAGSGAVLPGSGAASGLPAGSALLKAEITPPGPQSLLPDGLVTVWLEGRDSAGLAAASAGKSVVPAVGTAPQPVTFAIPFAAGDVPATSTLEALGRDGKPLPLQIDRKASHPDGSLRHAVLTLLSPLPEAGGRHPLTLRRKAGGAAPASPPAALPDQPAPDLQVKMVVFDGRILTASLKEAQAATPTPDVWLNGALVQETAYAVPLHDAQGKADSQLSLRVAVRRFGPGHPQRVEVILENGWTLVPGARTEIVALDVVLDGRLVLHRDRLVQPSHSRWRQLFWSGGTEPAVYVVQNAAYLDKTRLLPRYGADARVTDSGVTTDWQKYQASPHDLLDPALATPYMPMTGGRSDLGPLPRWTVQYLRSMDRRAYDIMMGVADHSGSWPVHYRDEKTGRPVLIADYPRLTNHENLVGRYPDAVPPVDKRGIANPLTPDTAHQPQLTFVPYLISGERFYLDEMLFWTQWNTLETAPEMHGLEKGLVHFQQVRGQAWSLRTLGMAAAIVPDADPARPVLQKQVSDNIAWYLQTHVQNPDANKLHMITNTGKDMQSLGYDDGTGMAPWQDDYFTWATGYLLQLGYGEAKPLLQWKARYPLGRMLDPNVCFLLASSYSHTVTDKRDAPWFTDFGTAYRATLNRMLKPEAPTRTPRCNTPEMAQGLGLKLGEMVGYAPVPDGYPSYLQPALAVLADAGIEGGKAAWDLFQSRVIKPDYTDQGHWDIVPR